MRCPSCGTENAADSRFCGGCGARLDPPEKPRVAPTHKISDDSPFPARPVSSAPPVSSPPSSGAPVSYAPPSMPPPADSSARTSDRRAAQRSAASGSLVLPARPMALIAIVVLIDIALAAAGAVLLIKGLAKPPPPAPERKTELSSETNVGAAARKEPLPAETRKPMSRGDSETSANVGGPADKSDAHNVVKSADNHAGKLGADKSRVSDKASPAKTHTTDKAATDKHATTDKHAATDKQPRTSDKSPRDSSPIIDPEIDFAPQVEQKSARSKAAFDRCVAAAGTVHGAIEIIFEIQRDGSVTRAGIGENTTENAELARCLAAEIERWKLSPHQGPIAQFVKSFIYP